MAHKEGIKIAAVASRWYCSDTKAEFAMRMIVMGVLAGLAACSSETAPLVEVGKLSAELEHCEAKQELPGECDRAKEALTTKKLEALAAGHSQADIAAASRIATDSAPDPRESPFALVAAAFSKSEVPAKPAPTAFKFFSSKFSCADVNSNGNWLVLRQQLTREEFIGNKDVFTFEPVDDGPRKPCLTLDQFPDGTFVLSAQQLNDIKENGNYLGETTIGFERVGEHEQKQLAEGQRESRINAEMSRLEAAYPDKYKCELSYPCHQRLRTDAMLSLGLVTQGEVDERKDPTKGGGFIRSMKMMPYQGDWCWNTGSDHSGVPQDKSKRSVRISLAGDSGGISGRHCVRDSRDRGVDCVNLAHSAPTIDGTWGNDAFTVRITSAFNGEVGTARIERSEGFEKLLLSTTQAAGPYWPTGQIELSKCITLEERAVELQRSSRSRMQGGTNSGTSPTK